MLDIINKIDLWFDISALFMYNTYLENIWEIICRHAIITFLHIFFRISDLLLSCPFILDSVIGCR